MKRLMWLFATAAALSACGGGGSSSPAPAPGPAPAPAPAPTAALPLGVIDTSCGGGTGRLALQPSANLIQGSNRGDLARYAQPLASGGIQLFGTTDNPTAADDIQANWWSILRLDGTCAIDRSFGNNGLQFYALSNPDYQVQDIFDVKADATGAATVFGPSYQPVTLSDNTSTFPYAATVQGFSAAGTRTAVAGHFFLTRPGSLYPDQLTSRTSAAALPNGQWLVLTRGSGTYDTASLRRLNADGTVDASFGTAGEMIFSEGLPGNLFERYTTSQLRAVAQDANGKLLIAGFFTPPGNGTSICPGVWRLNADGTPDASFGTGGLAATSSCQVASSDDGMELRVLASGKILVAGIAYVPGGRFEGVGLWRFLASGQIDLSYGSGGAALVDLGEGILPASCTDNPHSDVTITLDADETTYAGASLYCLNAAAGSLGQKWHGAVARIAADGTLDTGFGTNGRFSTATLATGGDEYLRSLSLTPDKKLLMFATGRETVNSAAKWVVYRVK